VSASLDAPVAAHALDSRRPSLARTLFSHRLGVIGFAILVPIVLLAIFADVIAPYDPNAADFRAILQPPSAAHWFGTDDVGRDVLSRIIYGSRVTLTVVAGAIAAGALAGVVLGLIAGYFGGWLDNILMRVNDSLLAFPELILALTLVAVLGPSAQNTSLAIAILNVPHFARVTRAETLSLRNRTFVDAARLFGIGHLRIMLRHLVPHLAGTIVIFAALRSSMAVITESGLSFLGLGVQPPTASWGNIVSLGLTYIYTAWWLVVVPSAAIFLLVISINLIGDAIRDANDVKAH
jgi:ABC-type dipeptide/oligopeptide/nickel transport system permease subunit